MLCLLMRKRLKVPGALRERLLAMPTFMEHSAVRRLQDLPTFNTSPIDLERRPLQQLLGQTPPPRDEAPICSAPSSPLRSVELDIVQLERESKYQLQQQQQRQSSERSAEP